MSPAVVELLTMAARDVEYERFVRDIVQVLLRADGLETVSVQHSVKVRGRSREHQIDVYWEYRLGGVVHRVIMNCKNYKSRVEVTDVLTLSGVLADMPGTLGLIVTTVGFQKGAIEYAQEHAIGLKIIRPPHDDDWEGRIREFHIDVRLDVPELLDVAVGLNRPWVEENLGEQASTVLGKFTVDARATVVRDLRTGEISTMNILWNRAMKAHPTEAGGEGTGSVQWEEALLESPGQPPVRIDQIRFRWRINEGESTPIAVKHEATAIVRDAIAGKLQFVHADGSVTPESDSD
jgi:hypothetical protein